MTMTPQRLCRMIDGAFAKTKGQRDARIKFMQQTVGRFSRNTAKYGDEAAKASPINLMATAINTLVPQLVFNDPRAKASTDLLAYRTYSVLLANGTTLVSKRTKFKDTLRLAVTDACFLAGFVKTGEAVADCVVEFGDGVDVNLTEPFMERVSPDDMILDPMARAWDEQGYLGNRYRADVDKLIEIGYGDPDELNKIAEDASYSSMLNKASDLSAVQNRDEPRRYVDLVEIWIPGDKRIVTMPYKTGKQYDKFVHDIAYGGPPKGQYHMLGFSAIPDNLLPAAPAGLWYDLHILGNRIARKIARQAERNKRVLAYEDDAEEDVDAIADANDGSTVRVQNLDKIKEVEYGGVSEKAYEWMTWVEQEFSKQAGSIDQLSGGGSDANTLGQAQMVQANSSVRLGDLQNIVYAFAGECLSDVAYSLHMDPMINLPLVRREGGQEVQDYYTPDARVGEWFDYHISVEPYSMARSDPNTDVRRKIEFATNVIPAAAQAAAMLGPGFKIGPYLTQMARQVGIDDADEWLNTDEVAQWIVLQAQLSQQTGSAGKGDKFANGGVGMPPPMLQPYLPGQPAPNPGQPAPGMTGPMGGISPGTEQAIAAQEAANPNQASTKSLALTRQGL